MALGAVTVVAKTTFGNMKVRIVDVVPTGGANYTTGGESLTAAMVGLGRILFVVSDHAKTSTGANILPVEYDRTNSKLQVYRYDGASAGKATLEEAAANFDASTFTARLIFFGTRG